MLYGQNIKFNAMMDKVIKHPGFLKKTNSNLIF